MLRIPPSQVRSAQALLSLATILAFAPSPAHPQTAPAQSQFTLQVQAPLVLEDVVVLDSHNQPVHNLKAADFTITDNDKLVSIQSFDEHAAPTPAQLAVQQASAPKIPDLGVNVFTNYTPVPPDAPLNILVLDALNTPLTDQDHTRQQMLKFLSDQPTGQRMAIFILSSRLYLLQGFTADPAVLKAAINSKGAHVPGSPLLEDAAGGDTNEGLYNSNMFDCPLCPPDVGRQGAADTATSVVSERVNRTLAAFNELAHYLSALPGRKNLIWFSAAFPILIPPDYTLNNPTAAAAHYIQQIRQTDDLLARSQVALYPADARGLVGNPATQASHGGPAPVQNMGRGSDPFLTSESNFMVDSFQEHQTLDQMAHDTGGKAFYNTGDLKGVVESAIALGSNYYSMSFTPPTGKWDGKYHKIDVKVNVPGLHLSYRRGYYADDPSLDNQGKQQFQASAMQAAMLHGAPQPSELLFDVRVIPGDATTDKLAPDSHPDPRLMQPPYRSFTLDTLLDIHFVQMTHANNGEYQGSLEVTVLVYNAGGDVVNTKTRLGQFVLPPDRYQQLLAHGLAASQSIDVPVKGTYFIRIGMHDPASNRVGAVEIPLSGLKSLQSMIAATRRSTPANQ